MKRLAITLSFLILLAACSKQCENEVLSAAVSPSGRIKAVVFQRGCGATVGANTQVSILPAQEALPNESGNVLIIDGQKAPLLFWRSDSQLEIHTANSQQTFKRETSFGGVTINYKTGP